MQIFRVSLPLEAPSAGELDVSLAGEYAPLQPPRRETKPLLFLFWRISKMFGLRPAAEKDSTATAPVFFGLRLQAARVVSDGIGWWSDFHRCASGSDDEEVVLVGVAYTQR